MNETIDGRTIHAEAVNYDLKSGNWTIHYVISDSRFGMEKKGHHTFDSGTTLNDDSTPRHVFTVLMHRFKEKAKK